jgi:hypothetical protein
VRFVHLARPAQQRWEARLFALGSLCFALGALPGYAELVGATADDATYAIGSVFFTVAAFTALRLTGRWTRRGWQSAGWSDWWAAAIQFLGTLFFNVSTFAALFGDDGNVWRPDAFGSVAFLVSSVLAVHAVSIRDRLWDPTARTWRVAWVNLLGSILFGVSALGAYTAPGATEVANATADNLGTFLGALCFLAGALLMTPDPARGPGPAGTVARSG